MADVHGDDYLALNRANWDARVPVHLGPGGYDLDMFRNDPDHLSDVVAFDRERLGDIAGKRVVHLQCHLGTDTVSLARLGAIVTGLDFSSVALEAARQLAADTGADIDFVEADVYDAAEVLGRERFDVVYTGIGAICWLPSIDRWAATVAGLLKSGGELFIRDGHPTLNICANGRPDGLIVIEYPYFEGVAMVFDEDTTYAGDGTPVASPRSVEFNHGLAEIFNALWRHGMEIVLFEEHDTIPWDFFGDQMEPVAGGEYRLIDRPERLPLSFTIRARKGGKDPAVE